MAGSEERDVKLSWEGYEKTRRLNLMICLSSEAPTAVTQYRQIELNQNRFERKVGKHLSQRTPRAFADQYRRKEIAIVIEHG